MEEIKKLVLAHEEIIGIHDLVVHDYGPGRRMISLHGEVPGNSDIFEIHDVIDRIEKELNQKLGCEAVIHMDPIEVNNEKVAEIRRILALKIAERLEGVTIHDLRMVQGPTHTNLVFDAVVPYGFPQDPCPGEGGDREDRSGDLGELLCGDPGGTVVYLTIK